jgi:hypothetical protein
MAIGLRSGGGGERERARKRERCYTTWCTPALTYSDTQNQGHKLRATAVTVLGWTTVAGAEDGAGGEPGWAGLSECVAVDFVSAAVAGVAGLFGSTAMAVGCEAVVRLAEALVVWR